MKIGLLSDTHSYLDEQVFHYFAGCDQVWHAGDIGTLELAKRLEAFRPLKAVYGNIDNTLIRKHYPLDQWFTCQGLKVWIRHIVGRPNNYTPEVRKILETSPPDILVAGHSHILRVARDPNYNRLLYLNPGAAGLYGIHTIRTLLSFEIINKKVCNMEVVELGERIPI